MFSLFTSKKNYKDIDAPTFKNMMSEEKTVIIDVRTANEFKSGNIEGAVNINVMSPQFANKIAELDKDKTYLVYCRSGNRSGQACNIMHKKGFEKLYNLQGGIAAW